MTGRYNNSKIRAKREYKNVGTMWAHLCKIARIEIRKSADYQHTLMYV
jgi:hypothetical protein